MGLVAVATIGWQLASVPQALVTVHVERNPVMVMVDDRLSRAIIVDNAPLEQIEALIREKPALALQNDERGPEPLYDAVLQNRSDVIRTLIAAGAPVNAIAASGLNRGMAPLHLAADQGRMEALQALLDGGANPSLRTKDGKTARDLAIRSRHYEIAKLLPR